MQTGLRIGGASICGDQAEHRVPPLRFASVGMTELFRYAWGHNGSVASHLCTERKDGAARGLVRVRGTVPTQDGWFAAGSRFLASLGMTMFEDSEHRVGHSFVSSS